MRVKACLANSQRRIIRYGSPNLELVYLNGLRLRLSLFLVNCLREKKIIIKNKEKDNSTSGDTAKVVSYRSRVPPYMNLEK